MKQIRAGLVLTLLVLLPGLVTCRAPTDCSAVDGDCSPLIVAFLFQPVYKATARFVYSTDTGSNLIRAVKIDSKTGAVLTNIGTFSTGTSPNVMVIDPSTRFLYCADFTADTVSVFSINASTGTLSLVQTLGLGAGANPGGLLIFSDYLLVSQSSAGFSNVQLYRRDSGTGMLTTQGSAVNISPPANSQPRQGMIHPNGRFLYLGLENGNAGTAQLTVSGASVSYNTNITLSTGTNLYDAVMTYDGRFVVVSVLGGTANAFVYSIDSATGALTQVSTIVPGGLVSHAIVAHPYLPVVYMGFESATSNLQAFQVSSSGVLSLFSTVTISAGNNKALAVDPQGGFLYSVNSSQGFVLAPLNPLTGAFATSAANAVAPGGTPLHVTIASYPQPYY
ncbi:MAG: lactonase family protein [Spirochaetia bacterium]|nr:lactonase family protein [Spirochaetia bacterium]